MVTISCFSILDWIVAVGTDAAERWRRVDERFQYPRLDRSGWNRGRCGQLAAELLFQYPRLDRSGWNDGYDRQAV